MARARGIIFSTSNLGSMPARALCASALEYGDFILFLLYVKLRNHKEVEGQHNHSRNLENPEYFGKLFGFLGMFIVPICVMTLKAFNDAGRIHLWNTANKSE